MIIGLLGFAGSGKGTVGKILEKDYGYNSTSFAASMKDAVSVIFDWPRNLLEGDTKESRDFRETVDEWWTKRLGMEVTPRYMMQLMGTEAGRNIFHQDLWVFSLEKRVTSDGGNFVITDVRFPNEIVYIKKLGGTIVRVVRGPEPKWFETASMVNSKNPGYRDLMNELYPDVHYSEWAWIGAEGCQDFQIINNHSTLEELHQNTKTFIQRMDSTL